MASCFVCQWILILGICVCFDLSPKNRRELSRFLHLRNECLSSTQILSLVNPDCWSEGAFRVSIFIFGCVLMSRKLWLGLGKTHLQRGRS